MRLDCFTYNFCHTWIKCFRHNEFIIQFIVGLEQAFNIEFDDSELALGLYYDMNDVVKAVAAKVS